MQPHIVNYHEALGIDIGTWIACEVCNATSVDIHHVIPRSKFGSKRKAGQDQISNLIALCRNCHNLAHDGKISKETLQEIISKLPKEREAIEEAYKNGYIDGDWHTAPEEYFTNLYERT
jgi:hypothetical protein